MTLFIYFELTSDLFYISLPQASLVPADRLYGIKKEILDGVGFASPQVFPITSDGMPLQLLAYLRLARIQDSAEFARVLPAAPLLLRRRA